MYNVVSIKFNCFEVIETSLNGVSVEKWVFFGNILACEGSKSSPIQKILVNEINLGLKLLLQYNEIKIKC